MFGARIKDNLWARGAQCQFLLTNFAICRIIIAPNLKPHSRATNKEGLAKARALLRDYPLRQCQNLRLLLKPKHVILEPDLNKNSLNL